jgi:hypothetical protein
MFGTIALPDFAMDEPAPQEAIATRDDSGDFIPDDL